MENNIDKIFNKSLQNYERQPRSEAWEKLQARLEKKDSKVLPLWWKYASAASVALLLGAGGYWFVNNSTNENPTVATNNEIKKQFIGVKSKANVLTQTKDNGTVIAEKIDLRKKNLDYVASVSKNIENSSAIHSKKGAIITKNAVIKPIDNQNEYKQSDLQNSSNQLVALETTRPKITETKTSTEQNTIVLVLENTKPKKEEETIVLNFVDTKVETVAQNTEPEKRQSRVGKIWEQLKRAKNGENVNWSEVGVKPQKVLARADAKIENALSKGEEENNR